MRAFATLITALFALTTALRPHPWYDPHYAVPLAGILLGNILNATSLSLGTASVLAGNWLLETPVFKIDDTTAATLERSLNAGTSIVSPLASESTKAGSSSPSRIPWMSPRRFS